MVKNTGVRHFLSRRGTRRPSTVQLRRSRIGQRRTSGDPVTTTTETDDDGRHRPIESRPSRRGVCRRRRSRAAPPRPWTTAGAQEKSGRRGAENRVVAGDRDARRETRGSSRPRPRGTDLGSRPERALRRGAATTRPFRNCLPGDAQLSYSCRARELAGGRMVNEASAAERKIRGAR